MESIEFTWDPKEFEYLLDSCKRDDAVKLTIDNIKQKNAKILEAGCGNGRVVKYLYDLGFKNIYGIELNERAVKNINKLYPELNIIKGNILEKPYPKDFFDVVAAYGVVEHFPSGPNAPLKALYDMLKPGGTAIITVPSFNIIRRSSYFLRSALGIVAFKRSNNVRKILGKRQLEPSEKNRSNLKYHVYPEIGQFYEYRMTKKEFEKECREAGFIIKKSLPISHIDGLYHTYPGLVKFENWEFKTGRFGSSLNELFKKIPFFHNHIHACVLEKRAF